ncbi:hypothetical protein LEMA_P102370.1 [Plenodomus lingam JN3]|uniref:Transcription factor domain-containing protein n=1 Tax=Leptosphaeria maculans (strain JN3 / isolate v23.1.3 / race Av1-4-5-6-7-8) TaxID=985895 RepID=E4ZZJ0_LEPMJ|nr:hypothetical protein LEMA_P102370.1 [Plenodomus lingam JN3]CBX97106.1 hypothetical protein LEMA_P102370.1 [Plenodomus lingam JN3]
MGDSVSALYASGMHCEGEFTEGANEEPLFLRESRRRIYAAVYRSDKTLAVFFGRPPMMGWRYSDRRQQLDVSDEAIASDDPNLLNEQLSRLDSAGWNMDRRTYPASYIRVRCQLAVFKERLLEQSLAGVKDSDVIRNIQAISAECTAWWEALPTHLRYETYSEEEAWIGLGAGMTVRLISAYLEYLHLLFQTQRLLHRQTQQALPVLLEISLKLLSTSLVSTKPNNRVYETRRHFPTVVLFYCFPAAGLLALELRRCTIEGVSLPSTVTRADVIRNLSVLTSCLEWIVLPGDGNSKLCSELNKMLAKVLDEVLNYEPPVNGALGNGEDLAGSGQGFFDMPTIDGLEPIPTQAEDFLDWLHDATWNNPDLDKEDHLTEIIIHSKHSILAFPGLSLLLPLVTLAWDRIVCYQRSLEPFDTTEEASSTVYAGGVAASAYCGKEDVEVRAAVLEGLFDDMADYDPR